jgi:hypothetical protein
MLSITNHQGNANQSSSECWCWWLTPGILAAREAAIRRSRFQDNPGKIVFKTPISTNSWAQLWQET